MSISTNERETAFMQLAEKHAEVQGVPLSVAIADLTKSEPVDRVVTRVVAASPAKEAELESAIAQYLTEHPGSTASEAIVEITRLNTRARR